jgi:protein-tyrosine kinase
MNQNSPVKPGGSLIERAAEIYDFARIQAPLTMPAPPAQPPLQNPVQQPLQQPTVSQPNAAPLPVHQPVTAKAPLVPVDMQQLREGGFILPDSAPSMLSEEFRLVKRQLLLSAFGGRKTSAVERGRAILVCSAQPNEGKTFCAVNLALSMASESDIEVLLVDADVAKPEVLSTLGLPGGPGLLDVLADPSLDVEECIIRTSIPQLSILPAGQQTNTDTELLASARTQVIVDGLLARNPRRIVIFDTAPALAASAASVLATLMGQVLMVVRADRSNENELREALALLGSGAHVRLLINAVTYAGNNQKYGSYYGYGG